MPRRPKSAWPVKALQSSARASLLRAYHQVKVDPQDYLDHIRRAHRLPIRSWDEMFYLGEEIVTPISDGIIRASSKTAALEGAGLGLGGFLTVIPDLGILSAITMRMLQKLSLIHGFEYTTEEESTEIWMAAASAAGLDLGKDFVEKQAVERLIPRLVDSIAAKVGADVAEKWSARLVPVLSAGAGGALNYYFVRAWGRRAQKHFLARHRQAAAQLIVLPPSSSPRPSLPTPIRRLPETN